MQLAEALVPFLVEVAAAFGGDLATAADHLRYPDEPALTLTGSPLGSDVWSSKTAQQLLEFLIEDPKLGEWFGRGGPLSTLELRSVLASVVASWAASGESAEVYASRHAKDILDALKEDPRSCWAVGLVYAIGVERRIDLPYGLAIEPRAETFLRNLLARGVLPEKEFMKAPKGYTCLFLQGASVSRTDWGSLAATTAAVWGHVAFQRLSTAVWLISGVHPVIGDLFVMELSAYPVTPFQHFPRPLQTYPRTPATILGERHVARLRSAVAQLEYVWSAPKDIDEKTDLQLRLALSHAEAVLRTQDSLLASLLSFVAIEGLLLYEKEDASRLGPRVAWLVGVDDDNRKTIRGFMEAFGRLRGEVAHGNPPKLDTLSKLVGRQLSGDEVDVYFSWSGREAGQTLEQRCTDVLRKVLLAFLNLALTVRPDDTVSSGPARKQIIEMLEAAAQRGPQSSQARNHLEANARALFVS